MPQISVVVPVYKVEKYLARCIDSILDQTYKDFELILVDDGSPDKCGEMCDEFARKDNRIKVIHKKNGGLSDARNVGIENAIGRYIAFVDSDDFIHSEMLSVLYENIIETSSEISICSFQMVYSESECLTEYQNKKIKLNNMDALHKLYGPDSVKFIVTWNKLYLKELFDDIKFPVGRLHEDEFTTYKLIYKSDSVVYSDAQLYFYFQREDSITGSKTIKNYVDTIDAYVEACDFYIEKNQSLLADKEIKKLFCFLSDSYAQHKQIYKILFLKNFRKCVFKYWSFIVGYKQKIWYLLYYLSPRMHHIISKIRSEIYQLTHNNTND